MIKIIGVVGFPFKKTKGEMVRDTKIGQMLHFTIAPLDYKTLPLDCKTFDKGVIDTVQEGLTVEVRGLLKKTAYQRKLDSFWVNDIALMIGEVRIVDNVVGAKAEAVQEKVFEPKHIWELKAEAEAAGRERVLKAEAVSTPTVQQPTSTENMSEEEIKNFSFDLDWLKEIDSE